MSEKGDKGQLQMFGGDWPQKNAEIAESAFPFVFFAFFSGYGLI